MMPPVTPVLKTVQAAGKAILSVYASDFSVNFKPDESPLTAADRAAHDIISRDLRRITPAVPVLSEEGRKIPHDVRKHWERFWLVDPLDGTKEFVKKNGEFTVNIALIENTRPVFGVVYQPVADACFVGITGLGAWRIERLSDHDFTRSIIDVDKPAGYLNAFGKKIATARPQREQLVIAGSRSHGSEAVAEYVGKMKLRYDKVTFISAGSSLKLCLVAEGKAHEYPRFGPTMEWDTAAGQAVVEAAGGGVICHETGRPLQYNKENLLNPWFLACGGMVEPKTRTDQNPDQ